MKQFNFYLVDVFTDIAFGGNQLAVFPNGEGISDELMQNIARELNYSETTFVLPPENPNNDCKVRIFTPATELPMAGHPTIGTAFVLLCQEILKPKHENYLIFEEGVGNIKVEYLLKDRLPDMITMNQPLPHFGAEYKDTTELAKMLSIRTDQIDSRYPAQVVTCGLPTLFIPIKDLMSIMAIKLRLDVWEQCLADFETRQVFVFTTETENAEATVHSRFFAPALGIIEDPATGAASGPLGCYLVKHGIINVPKDDHIISEQGYEIGRPSTIFIEIGAENRNITSVKVGGKCVLMGEGSIYLRA